MKVNQFPDRIIEVKEESYLYFGGTALRFQLTDYKKTYCWGSAYGSSNANIQLTAYEKEISKDYIGAAATVTVSSGMLAAKLVIEELTLCTDVFFHFLIPTVP
jgi:hypothetical protein